MLLLQDLFLQVHYWDLETNTGEFRFDLVPSWLVSTLSGLKRMPGSKIFSFFGDWGFGHFFPNIFPNVFSPTYFNYSNILEYCTLSFSLPRNLN